MIEQYSHYSAAAIKAELDNIKRISVLLKDMEKPDNFTYIDVLNLHNYIDTLKNELTTMLKTNN